jgi:3-dehydroquinate dehydratase-1
MAKNPQVTSIEANDVQYGNGMTDNERTLTVIYGTAREDIVELTAEVLGRTSSTAGSFTAVKQADKSCVVGIHVEDATRELATLDASSLMVINTHCDGDGDFPNDMISPYCDFEFLYTKQFLRRDLTRFLTQILGQSNFHEQLLKKKRTNLISTTFPDVRAALSNLDILSVGADAIEIRVDLLKEPRPDGGFTELPSISYVARQVMLLRQRTELPIIYTTRCTRENGKFPMDDPNLFYDYLSRAIQWGVEYIDVELWLPEDIRKRLFETKGHSRILSAFHDFSGSWKWENIEAAQQLFKEGSQYADIVKMIAMINTMDQNYQLEYFRSTIRTNFPHPPHPPLSAVNMGQMGQLSRALNTVFSPITHPLLPRIAAPGQLSAAEINGALHIMGQLPKRDIYAIGNFRSTPQSLFFEKCINELGLPHQFACVDRGPKGSAEPFVKQPNFGGAYLNPPLLSSTPYIPSVSDAAKAIGQIDTIVVRDENGQHSFVGENAGWRGIRATLTRDFVPSAYLGRAAIVLSSSEADASAAIFALRSLKVGIVYTVGFKAQGPLAPGLEPFTSVESIKWVEQPFVIISALPAEKSLLVQPLLRHYSANGQTSPRSRGKVFLDFADGSRKGEPLPAATTGGWTAYGISDVNAWTTVETLRLLVGQNVPYDFVRLASGRQMF